MNVDKAREYIVVINEGSGCLIRPLTDEYIYVLTAKHNISDSNNNLEKITRFNFIDGDWVSTELKIDKLIEGENYFPHPIKDIAIIKLIGEYEEYDSLFRLDQFGEKKNYSLLGYPEMRRENNAEDIKEWFRRDEGITIFDSRGNDVHEAGIPGNPTLDEVSGDSGGAILKIIGNIVYLAGIQTRMADENEQMGRIRFTGMSSFDEITELFPEQLAPIFPPHLKSFSFLHSEAFNLNGGLFANNNTQFTKIFLKHKANEVIKSPLTPIGIKRMFEERLLIFNQDPCFLQSKSIWIIWLEFLTILNILIEENLCEQWITDTFQNIRLICSDTSNDWSDELSNLIYSDYRGLKKNGIVIIGVSKPPLDDETYILEKKIPHIANAFKEERKVVERSLLQIDAGIKFPLEDFKFIHIEYFKKRAIIKKHAEYADIEDDSILLNKLKIEYQILLGHEQKHP